MTESYYGWTNKETWCVSLWLNNDEYSYRFLRSIKDKYARLSDQAEYLKQAIEERLYDEVGETAGLLRDIIGYPLNKVDWLEIVELA